MDKMGLKEKLFALAFILHMIAISITVFLVSNGAIEGNPIFGAFLSLGVYPALVIFVTFITAVWCILYVILIDLPDKRYAWHTGSLVASGVLVLMISIDLINDLRWLYEYLFVM